MSFKDATKQPYPLQVCLIWQYPCCRFPEADIGNCAQQFVEADGSNSGRRTYITRLANKGVGVRLLAELAGHSHISTTQRYIDVNSEQLSEAVELL